MQTFKKTKYLFTHRNNKKQINIALCYGLKYSKLYGDKRCTATWDGIYFLLGYRRAHGEVTQI